MTKCKICNEETTPLEIETILYHRCSNCGFVYLDEKHYLSSDKEKKRYLLHDNTLQNKGYVKMLEEFIEKTVVAYVKVGERVLDYGSGPEPVLAELLRRRKFNVEIYDKYFNYDDFYVSYDKKEFLLDEIYKKI